MAVAKVVWGIDIGRCALKALKVRQTEGDKLEAIALDYIEHPKMLSQPDADAPALIRSALETFFSRNDLTGTAVVVGVPGRDTLARITKLPPVEPKKIPDIVRFEASQVIPFDIDEVIWDYQTFSSPDSPDVEVGIFAMKRELVRQHLAYFAEARIDPIAVQAGPLALYNAMMYDGQCEGEATVLLDIGAENTDLIVAAENGLWTRTIPLGGNNFTEALVKAFKLSFGKAESLKRTAATSKYARQIFQAMRPVFAELVSEVQRSIGFYSSTHRDVRLQKVVGVGNAFKLPGLQKFLQQNLGLEVVRPGHFNKLAASSAANASQFIEHLLSFGVAYGLALQGLGLAKITSNLLPPEIAKQIVWRKKRLAFAAAAACLWLASGMIWGRYLHDARTLEEAMGRAASVPRSLKYNQAKAMLASLQDTLPPRQYAATVAAIAKGFADEYNKLSTRGGAEEKKRQDIIGLQTDKILWPRIVHLIHSCLPRPQEDLAKAASPREYLQAVKAGGSLLARQNRREIFIEHLEAEYTEDIVRSLEQEASRRTTASPELAARRFGRRRARRAEQVRAEPKPGFVIRLQVRTPYVAGQRSGAIFVYDKLIQALRSKAREPGRGFYLDLDQIEPIVDEWKYGAGEAGPTPSYGRPSRSFGGGVGDVPSAAYPGRFPRGPAVPGYTGDGVGYTRRGTEYGGRYGDGVYRPYRPSPTGGLERRPAVPTAARSEGLKDPLTGESMADDLVCLVVFGVVLGEPPAEEATAAGQAPKAAARAVPAARIRPGAS